MFVSYLLNLGNLRKSILKKGNTLTNDPNKKVGFNEANNNRNISLTLPPQEMKESSGDITDILLKKINSNRSRNEPKLATTILGNSVSSHMQPQNYSSVVDPINEITLLSPPNESGIKTRKPTLKKLIIPNSEAFDSKVKRTFVETPQLSPKISTETQQYNYNSSNMNPSGQNVQLSEVIAVKNLGTSSNLFNGIPQDTLRQIQAPQNISSNFGKNKPNQLVYSSQFQGSIPNRTQITSQVTVLSGNSQLNQTPSFSNKPQQQQIYQASNPRKITLRSSNFTPYHPQLSQNSQLSNPKNHSIIGPSQQFTHSRSSVIQVPLEQNPSSILLPKNISNTTNRVIVPPLDHKIMTQNLSQSPQSSNIHPTIFKNSPRISNEILKSPLKTSSMQNAPPIFHRQPSFNPNSQFKIPPQQSRPSYQTRKSIQRRIFDDSDYSDENSLYPQSSLQKMLKDKNGSSLSDHNESNIIFQESPDRNPKKYQEVKSQENNNNSGIKVHPGVKPVPEDPRSVITYPLADKNTEKYEVNPNISIIHQVGQPTTSKPTKNIQIVRSEGMIVPGSQNYLDNHLIDGPKLNKYLVYPNKITSPKDKRLAIPQDLEEIQQQKRRNFGGISIPIQTSGPAVSNTKKLVQKSPGGVVIQRHIQPAAQGTNYPYHQVQKVSLLFLFFQEFSPLDIQFSFQTNK